MNEQEQVVKMLPPRLLVMAALGAIGYWPNGPEVCASQPVLLGQIAAGISELDVEALQAVAWVCGALGG